ncbi:MAG: M20 family peptidase [Sneathiellales bacterium]|nr:M20 family peptidase [Sneathiellales bacterium]
MIKKLSFVVFAAILVVVAVVAYKTITNTPDTITAETLTAENIDVKDAAERLGQAIRYKTISYSVDHPVEEDAFKSLHNFIDKSFPLVTQNLKKEVIGGYSLLYTWEGSDSSLKPIILMAHQDVVPVEKGTEQDWNYPPYSGKIAEGAIWGRGSLDDKVSVIGILEAAEHLLKKNFKPEHTLIFAFGHDEEIGGQNGAAEIVKRLKSRNISPLFTLDEGMVVVKDVMPGIERPIALIALAEKGYLTLELTAKAEGGHSSLPPRATAVGKISRAIARIEENRPPAALKSPASDMLETLAPHMPLSLKAVISNRWLLDGVLVGELEKSKTTNAMVRTTTAATIINGGTKDNVLPSIAKATVNFRLLPGDTIEDIKTHVINVVADPDVTVEVMQGNNPSKVSSMQNKAYGVIAKTIREVLPDVLISPGLMLAGSDSKHYEEIAENSYRFIPMRFGPDDIARVHGTNERILVDNYGEIIRFYIRFMENTKN